MNSKYHVALLRGPYFHEGKAALHRYLDPGFVQQFQRDLQTNRLAQSEKQEWRESDRFSDHDNKPVLRLPMHKCFYLVSCEVVCDRMGTPALDPRRISSAGFVIRRITPAGEESWMMEDDHPLGWEPSSTGLHDPDAHRFLCRNGCREPRAPVPTYTGELTHPLHPVQCRDGQGKLRTVLYGYVPLGGTYTVPAKNKQTPFGAASLKEFSSAASRELPWPFGLRGSLDRTWLPAHAQPVRKGVPGKEFFELLRLLVNRYHLGENGVAENEALQALTEEIYFYDQDRFPHALKRQGFDDFSRDKFKKYRTVSLWTWLREHGTGKENRLVQWLAHQEEKITTPGDLDSVSFDPLPSSTSHGTLKDSLFLSQGDARDFRTLLDQRVLDQALQTAKDMPLPKFGQEKDDVYQIVPFVRIQCESGRERICWAGEDARSELFRVAAPFTPGAARPSMIQMPSLGDLRRGFANGVGMITPSDTFKLLNTLNFKKGVSDELLSRKEDTGLGIQWICSFSLPVITLVAMILLMIVISLLNIVFFWLPWVKICLPFPKRK